jgi:hypothetical protein
MTQFRDILLLSTSGRKNLFFILKHIEMGWNEGNAAQSFIATFPIFGLKNMKNCILLPC